jgi:hypothetical protein
MTTAQLRKRAAVRLDNLPPDKMRIAVEFLDYLDAAASREATEELLQIPGLLEDARNAAKCVKKRQYKNWRKVRKDA